MPRLQHSTPAPPARLPAALAVGVLAALIAALALASVASADFTRIKIREVKPGATGATAASEFVELQMYEGAQQNVGGQTLTIFGPTGMVVSTFQIPADAASGQIQRSILIGTASVADEHGVAPDFVLPGPVMTGQGGGVCYADIDCVAWGTFPAKTGNAEAIPDGSALERTITRGCPTYLEEGDDSGFSSLDFDLISPPSPRNNATPPDEVRCAGLDDRQAPQTRITKGPAGETTKRRLRINFTSTEPGSTFECRLDKAGWEDCKSPYRPLGKGARLEPGRHLIEVRATDESGNTDNTPARRKWTIKGSR